MQNSKYKIEIICEKCGKKVIKYKSALKNNKTNKCFCSFECKKKYISKNIINIKENYAEIIIYSPKYGEKTVLIDIDDINKISKYFWYVCFCKKTNNFYVATNSNGRFQIHRYIMNFPKNMVIDHINHNGLDNRKENLRVCSHKENMSNKKLYKNNNSGYSGIIFKKNKYIVQIGSERKYLGSFNSIKEAIATKIKEEKNRNFFKIIKENQ